MECFLRQGGMQPFSALQYTLHAASGHGPAVFPERSRPVFYLCDIHCTHSRYQQTRDLLLQADDLCYLPRGQSQMHPAFPQGRQSRLLQGSLCQNPSDRSASLFQNRKTVPLLDSADPSLRDRVPQITVPHSSPHTKSPAQSSSEGDRVPSLHTAETPVHTDFSPHGD